MTFGFETALSALGAARTALGVIGHNLTNSATPGYSRQRITTTSARPDLIRPGLAVGRGVVVTGVQRVVDDFVTTRLRQATLESKQGAEDAKEESLVWGS